MRSPVRLSELSFSPQAIMMSICLQSMVDELMVKKSGGSIRKVNGTRDPAAGRVVLCSPVVFREGGSSREGGEWLGSEESSCLCQHLGLSSDAAAASGGSPAAVRQPASGQVPATACKWTSVSALAPSPASPSLRSSSNCSASFFPRSRLMPAGSPWSNSQ